MKKYFALLALVCLLSSETAPFLPSPPKKLLALLVFLLSNDLTTKEQACEDNGCEDDQQEEIAGHCVKVAEAISACRRFCFEGKEKSVCAEALLQLSKEDLATVFATLSYERDHGPVDQAFLRKHS